jgi:hypothetical protein
MSKSFQRMLNGALSFSREELSRKTLRRLKLSRMTCRILTLCKIITVKIMNDIQQNEKGEKLGQNKF